MNEFTQKNEIRCREQRRKGGDNKKKAGEFYITDAIEKTWTLSRLYLTKDEAQTFKNNVGINET